MRVHFDTTEYQFSHGRQPRGYGRWGFAYDPRASWEQMVWFHGSYADCKKQMVARAKADGQDDVVVMP